MLKEKSIVVVTIMDDKTCSSSSVTGPQKASNHDELFMQQSLLFSDTLMELKNISKQLYSAADYFEISYSNKGQKKQEAVKTLKDYAIKALINTVDHLGTVAYKINSFVDAEIGVISALDLKLSCVEQRLQSCQDYISKDGFSQHSLAAKQTQHHKHYMFPVNKTINASENRKEGGHYRRLSADNNLHQLKKDVHEINNASPSFNRQRSSPSLSPGFPSRQGPFTLTRNPTSKKPEKRAASPHRFPPLGSASLLKRSISPTCFRVYKRYPSELKRSFSSTKYDEKQRAGDLDQNSNGTKHLLKALLGMGGKSRKGDSLSKFTDGI